MNLGLSRVVGSADDRPGVAHALALGRRAASDECHHRLDHVLLDPQSGVGLVGPANLADHHHRISLLIALKELEQVDEVESLDRIAANADAGGLPDAKLRALP